MSKSIAQWQTDVHALAVKKGWYNQERDPLGLICLVHSELSEAVEEWRRTGDTNYILEDCRKPVGFPIEIADAVIRILSMCEHFGIDLESAMERKHEYNKTRPYRHGDKLA